MNEQFDKTYKKTTTQLKLLSKVQKHLTKDATDAAIRAYILPTVMFSCLTNLKLNNTQIRKLDSISNRIKMLSTKTCIDFENERNKYAAKIVRKCLDNKLCENFQQYFNLNSHNINTRNNEISIDLPKCKLEFSKCGFYYMNFI